MFARVMSAGLKMEAIDQAAIEWRAHISPFKNVGIRQALMLVDRATGKYLSITIWESEAAQRRNAASPGQVAERTAMTQKYFIGPPTATTYDVIADIE